MIMFTSDYFVSNVLIKSGNSLVYFELNPSDRDEFE